MHIKPVRDSETAKIVAGWHYREWGIGYPGKIYGDFIADVHGAIGSMHVPLVLVASVDDVVVGTVSIILDDLPTRLDLNPWLASLYVLPVYRNRGIGTALIYAAVEQARVRRIARLFLFTHDRAPFYAKFGWHKHDVGEFMDQKVDIMLNDFNATD